MMSHGDWSIPVRDGDGSPICFICGTPVGRAGETCSRACYAHFLMAVLDSPGLVSMEELLDLDEQPWYAEPYNG